MTDLASARPRVRAGIVGSLPRPESLVVSADVRVEWKLPEAELDAALDEAVRQAVRDQEAAGLDVVTDGEQRRRHYIRGFVESLPGFDYGQSVPKSTRGGRYQTQAPVIVAPPEWPAPVLAGAIAFARRCTTRLLKVTIPGPVTISDTFHNASGLSEEQLVRRLAGIVNQEARAAVAAGADVVQIDEPGLCAYVDKAEAWGIEALDRCLDGVAVPTVVHICYGYGTPLVLEWKRHNTRWDQYAQLLPLLRHSRVGGLSLEFAASGLNPALLADAGDKEIWYGAVDVSLDSPAETAQHVAARLKRALEYVPAERLVASTDCGMIPLSQATARAKMAALAEGARLASERHSV